MEEAEREHELTRKKKPKAKAVPRENPPDQADKNSPSPKTPAVMDPPKSSAAKSTPKTPVTKNTLSTLAFCSANTIISGLLHWRIVSHGQAINLLQRRLV